MKAIKPVDSVWQSEVVIKWKELGLAVLDMGSVGHLISNIGSLITINIGVETYTWGDIDVSEYKNGNMFGCFTNYA